MDKTDKIFYKVIFLVEIVLLFSIILTSMIFFVLLHGLVTGQI